MSRVSLFSFFLWLRTDTLLLPSDARRSTLDARHPIPDSRFPISEPAYLRTPGIANDPTTIRFYPNSLRKISIDVIRAFIISSISSVRIRLLPSLRFPFTISIVSIFSVISIMISIIIPRYVRLLPNIFNCRVISFLSNVPSFLN